jgi:hypothetical protein
MNLADQERIDGRADSCEFEATLRLISSLPAPEGLTERMQAGLRAGTGTSTGRARVLAWPAGLRSENGWLQSSLARSAAAAAIAIVVAGGGWGVYSRVQPKQSNRAVTISPRVAVPGGFSSAGAMRTPQTLNGPEVARPGAIGTQAAKADGRATTPATVRRGKSAAGKKTVAPATR